MATSRKAPARPDEQFKALGTTQKGEYFEQIVRDWLWARGHRTTAPAHAGPHPVDMFCMRAPGGELFAIDAKAYCRREQYADTGIDWRHFNAYRLLEKSAAVKVWVFFGDHREGWVYGAHLDDLCEGRYDPPGCKPGHYPRKEGKKIYFPRAAMARLFPLTAEQCATLEAMTRGRLRASYDLPGMEASLPVAA